VQYHLGMTHYMMGEEDSARVALQRALQLSADFPGADEARQRLAILAIDPAAVGNEARALLTKAVAENPDDPVALARLAAIYERDGSVEKAIAALESARKVNPNNAPVLMNLARLYAAHHDATKARELAEAARKVAPDDPNVTHILGRLAFQTGDYPWAASLLQQDPGLQFDLANANYAVGRTQDAETAMQLALKLNAGFAHAEDARRFLDLTALAANPAQAVASAATVEQALKSDPANVPALMAMGAIQEARHNAAAAIETYGKVLDAFPRDADLTKAFGIIVYRRGDYARAASLLQESADQRGSDAELQFYLGMARYRLNRRAEAKQALQRALELGLTGDPATQAKKTIAEIK
jgi:Flp pilus assembly protein TadD